MAQRLRALVALCEDLGFIPSIHIVAHNLTCNSVPKESDFFF